MNKQFIIKDLGKATHTAPSFNLGSCSFVDDDERVLYDVIYNEKTKQVPDPEFSFEKAGPRKTMFFDPKKTKAAIVTCGGLCQE